MLSVTTYPLSPPRIELGFQAPQACVLSITLWGYRMFPPGIEPGISAVLEQRLHHLTMETRGSTESRTQISGFRGPRASHLHHGSYGATGNRTQSLFCAREV
jgi:hypothetical protein